MPMIETWTHTELQLAKSMGYQMSICAHHLLQSTTDLFHKYIDTFFQIKKQAQSDGIVGLKELAKLMINSPTGKWGFNPFK